MILNFGVPYMIRMMTNGRWRKSWRTSSISWRKPNLEQLIICYNHLAISIKRTSEAWQSSFTQEQYPSNLWWHQLFNCCAHFLVDGTWATASLEEPFCGYVSSPASIRVFFAFSLLFLTEDASNKTSFMFCCLASLYAYGFTVRKVVFHVLFWP